MEEKNTKKIVTIEKNIDKEKGDLDDFIFSMQENKRCSER